MNHTLQTLIISYRALPLPPSLSPPLSLPPSLPISPAKATYTTVDTKKSPSLTYYNSSMLKYIIFLH